MITDQVCSTYLLWSDALRKWIGYSDWLELVMACESLPRESRCVIHGAQNEGIECRAVEVYRGPASGIEIGVMS